MAAEWMGKVGLPNEMERDRREFDGDVSLTSQFSREIVVTELPDGLPVTVAAR